MLCFHFNLTPINYPVQDKCPAIVKSQTIKVLAAHSSGYSKYVQKLTEF